MNRNEVAWMAGIFLAVILLFGCLPGIPVSEVPDGVAVAPIDPQTQIDQQAGENLQSGVETLFPPVAALRGIGIEVPAGHLIDPNTGEVMRDPRTGAPFITTERVGIGAAIAGLLGGFFRQRRKEKEFEGRIDHERKKRKGLELKLPTMQPLTPLPPRNDWEDPRVFPLDPDGPTTKTGTKFPSDPTFGGPLS